jgi:hypothetical protein
MKSKINTLLLLTIILSGCKKFVSVQPPYTQLVGKSVYSTNAAASSAVTGIYATIVGNSIGGNEQGFSALLGLSSDEFSLFPTSNNLANQVYSNNILSTQEITFWSDLYNCIYQANSAIEGMSSSTGVTPLLKQQLIGEAKFLRAFANFYLVTIYGDVPLVTSTDYKTNAIIHRSSKLEVYDQIISDLQDAQSLLSDDYRMPDGSVSVERVRPNKGSATALLARTFLYLEKWDKAEAEATAVINNNNYQMLTDLNEVFLSTNNKEAIWQLESPNNGGNAPDGAFLTGYLYFGGPSTYAPFLLSDSLISSFESGDLRKDNWVIQLGNYFFPYKYKLSYTGLPPTEYPTVLRLAEQYLIRAEARAQQNKLSDAIGDLDVVRKRANLTLISNTNPGISKQALVDLILHERRIELFTEYGHRWFDLRRSGIMAVVSPQKGGKWSSYKALYPIPQSELDKNPNLTQNLGY